MMSPGIPGTSSRPALLRTASRLGGPDRHLPERIAAPIARAGDHLAKTLLDLRSRHAGVLHDRVGVPVAPGFPDAGEDLALDAQRVHDDVVYGDLAQAQVREQREHLAADVQVAPDRCSVEVGDALPEPVGVER